MAPLLLDLSFVRGQASGGGILGPNYRNVINSDS